MKIEQIAAKRGYVVTEEGVLLNPKGLELQSVDNGGYIKTTIRLNGKAVIFFAHRLQAFQKYGELLYNESILVRHLNSNKEDNSWQNIAIGTHSDNMLDIPKQIRIKKAIHASSFLKKYKNKEIIRFHKLHKSYKKTMDQFNISSKGTLNYILNPKNIED
jgi:hypothetical protein